MNLNQTCIWYPEIFHVKIDVAASYSYSIVTMKPPN